MPAMKKKFPQYVPLLVSRRFGRAERRIRLAIMPELPSAQISYSLGLNSFTRNLLRTTESVSVVPVVTEFFWGSSATRVLAKESINFLKRFVVIIDAFDETLNHLTRVKQQTTTLTFRVLNFGDLFSIWGCYAKYSSYFVVEA